MACGAEWFSVHLRWGGKLVYLSPWPHVGYRAVMADPKLRTVNRWNPPYPLGRFPAGFVDSIARDVVFMLATESIPTIEGERWELIFSRAIRGDWEPSQVGLDDVKLSGVAWSAKSVKARDPWKQSVVRLISGRCSPQYSFDRTDFGGDPQPIGSEVLSIWNGRVADVRSKYNGLRTVVLLRSDDQTRFAVFEFETVKYPIEDYVWSRNRNGNFVGRRRSDDIHVFTWQPHGSQLTIIEAVPAGSVKFRVDKPNPVQPDVVLEAVGFDSSWIHRDE